MDKLLDNPPGPAVHLDLAMLDTAKLRAARLRDAAIDDAMRRAARGPGVLWRALLRALSPPRTIVKETATCRS